MYNGAWSSISSSLFLRSSLARHSTAHESLKLEVQGNRAHAQLYTSGRAALSAQNTRTHMEREELPDKPGQETGYTHCVLWQTTLQLQYRMTMFHLARVYNQFLTS
jgi:hypothetical protein